MKLQVLQLLAARSANAVVDSKRSAIVLHRPTQGQIHATPGALVQGQEKPRPKRKRCFPRDGQQKLSDIILHLCSIQKLGALNFSLDCASVFHKFCLLLRPDRCCGALTTLAPRPPLLARKHRFAEAKDVTGSTNKKSLRNLARLLTGAQIRGEAKPPQQRSGRGSITTKFWKTLSTISQTHNKSPLQGP